MLEVTAGHTRADIGTTALPYRIDSLAHDAAAVGDGLGESIRYSNRINHDHRHLKCILDRCWKSRFDGLALT